MMTCGRVFMVIIMSQTFFFFGWQFNNFCSKLEYESSLTEFCCCAGHSRCGTGYIHSWPLCSCLCQRHGSHESEHVEGCRCAFSYGVSRKPHQSPA